MTTERARLVDLLYEFFPAQVIQTMARLAVLRDCHAAMPADGTLLVVESVVPDVLRAVPA